MKKVPNPVGRYRRYPVNKTSVSDPDNISATCESMFNFLMESWIHMLPIAGYGSGIRSKHMPDPKHWIKQSATDLEPEVYRKTYQIRILLEKVLDPDPATLACFDNVPGVEGGSECPLYHTAEDPGWG